MCTRETFIDRSKSDDGTVSTVVSGVESAKVSLPVSHACLRKGGALNASICLDK